MPSAGPSPARMPQSGPRATIPITDLYRQHGPLAGELRAVFDRILGTSGFIMGAEVEAFERAFAEYCGTEYCVGVASGTAALTIMMQAAGIGPGDEVIVPAHTFVASALAVMHAGATPVCVDVEAATALIDAEAVRAAIGPSTVAILAVHLYGQVCAMDPLRALAERHGLALLEDAAQAHGARYGDARAGCLGLASAFSFYPSKNLGALGDGGAICTDDPELAAVARRFRDLGRDGDSQHSVLGYNERLDGLQAGLLSVKLPHVERWNADRRKLAGGYRDSLDDGLQLHQDTPQTPCTYHLFPIRVSDRDGLARHLAEDGIQAGVHYPVAVPDQPALASGPEADTPIARDWAARELSLPIFPGMRAHELERVAASVNAWLAAS